MELPNTDNNEKPRPICPDCSREFSNMGAMKSHLRTHRTVLGDTTIQHTGTVDEHSGPCEDESKTRYKEYLKNMVEHYGDPVPYEPTPIVVKVKKLPHGMHLPDLQYATPGSAAVDLYAAIDKPLCIGVGERANPPIPTGIAVEIPQGYYGKIAPRSGMGINHGITFINSPGTIDADYRGEIKVGLINHSRAKYWINPGDRICQMIITKVEPVKFEYVDELSDTERGTGGFGSTGKTVEIEAKQTINFMDSAEKPDGVSVRKLPPDHDLLRNRV